MERAFEYLLLLPTGLANPFTPWIVLALCAAGWLAVYVATSGDSS
jgi:hypothetical protein